MTSFAQADELMLYHLYSGQLQFSAIAALIAFVALDLAGALGSSGVGQSVARVGGLLALALVAFSGNPIPLWLAFVGGALALAHLLVGIGTPSRLRYVSGILVIVAALTSVALEAPYHVRQRAPEKPSRIIVIGDSLSSGGFGESESWPALLGSEIGCEVVNLARPGDTVASAIDGQLPDIPDRQRGDLVIVELGGNDMLEGIDDDVFAALIEDLSGGVSRAGRPVMMFELPLLPGRWGYGAAQRRVARERELTLIPKRVLAGVLLRPDNTSDGLHLTQPGHDALVEALVRWAGWQEVR